MKNKILLSGILVITLIFAFNICFAAQSSNSENGNSAGTTVQNQQQTQNQGEDTQIQTQSNEQVQSGNTEQNQTQQQTQNQGEETQIQTKAQIREQAKTVNGEMYRNTVSNVVQELLEVADNTKGGIGEQVRVIAQEQEKTREQVADQIESIQQRNGIKTFLIGTNYRNLGALRSEMVNTENRLKQLNNLMEQTQNQSDQDTLQLQIQTMQAEQERINSFIQTNESKFSLFGWFVKLFVK
jgi:hypothetical protein